MKTLPIFLLPIAVIAHASAGDLSKRSYSRSFEWESTDCYKPYPPSVFDLDDFERSQIESYLSDVQFYRSCVANEASDDYDAFLKKLAEAIEEGREEALAEIDRDIDNLRSSIELAR